MGKIACEVREKVVDYINKAKEKYNISRYAIRKWLYLLYEW